MNAETETVKCPACDWRGHPVSAYQTKAGPFCPNCIDEGGHIRCVPAATTPPPLSAKGLDGNEVGFTTTVQDDGPPHPLMQRDRHGKWGFPTMEADPTTGTPNDVAANARLCAAIAAVLTRDDLTPEARTLVEGALRAQRGEAVDLRAEMERRGVKTKSLSPQNNCCMSK